MDLLTLIIVILLILWVLGAVSVGGNLVHALLVIALIIVVVKLVRGEKI